MPDTKFALNHEIKGHLRCEFAGFVHSTADITSQILEIVHSSKYFCSILHSTKLKTTDHLSCSISLVRVFRSKKLLRFWNCSSFLCHPLLSSMILASSVILTSSVILSDSYHFQPSNVTPWNWIFNSRFDITVVWYGWHSLFDQLLVIYQSNELLLTTVSFFVYFTYKIIIWFPFYKLGEVVAYCELSIPFILHKYKDFTTRRLRISEFKPDVLAVKCVALNPDIIQ